MHIDPRRFRYGIAGLIVLALIAVMLWPAARLVDSGIVDRGPVRETVDAEGRTRVHDRYVIAAPVASMARRLTLEPGDAITVGQVLVVLDPVTSPTLDARSLAEAKAQLAAARARLGAAREEAKAATALAQQLRTESERQTALALNRLVATEAAERAQTAALHGERDAASAKFREATARHEVTAAEAVIARGSRDQPVEAALELRRPGCRHRAAAPLRERPAGAGRRAPDRDRRSGRNGSRGGCPVFRRRAVARRDERGAAALGRDPASDGTRASC